MVERLVTSEDGERLREWMLGYMKDDGNGVEPKRAPASEDRLIGPTQLCNQAGLDPKLGSTLLGSGKVARAYVPMAEYLRKLVVALREMLEDIGDSRAQEVTVIRAFIEGGYLRPQDVVEFLEAEGAPGWMRKEDCLSGLDLGKLNDRDRLVVEELYHFQLLRRKEPAEEVGDQLVVRHK